MQKPKAHSKTIRLVYFWIGIASTFAYRIIVVLNNYNPVWVQSAWYFGTIGFIIYFIHRYQVSEKRAKLVETHKLDVKINHPEELSAEDKEALSYILSTLKSTKEKWNYIFIFVASGVALAWGVYADFLSPLLK